MASFDRTLFDSFPFAQLVLKVSSGNELTLYASNTAAASLYDFAAEHAEGRMLHHVLQHAAADFFESAAHQAIAEGKAIVTETENLFPVAGAAQSFTVTPIFDKKQKVTHVHIVALPADAEKLTLQKERDHALMLMSSVFDASNLGILVTDRHRRILRVNDAFLTEFGFKRRDLMGLDFTQIFVPADRRIACKSYKQFVGGNSTAARREWRLRGGNDKEADVLVTTAPLHLNADRPLVIHTFVDISDHKHLEESLRWAKDQADSANRAKSAFLASMSHELRTPLNAILGFSELIRNETFGAVGHAKYKEYLGDIHFAATHLLEIINDVLDMSKIEAGKFELTEAEVDIGALFQSVARLMADRASAARIAIDQQVEIGVEAIMGDKRVLRQMLFNLVSNALKFSHPHSSIHLSARVDLKTDEIMLIVRDFGRGMDPKDIERVLEPFNQAQAGVNDGTGTGLGLPLTRAMAELHGGSLHLESQIGMGTIVTIRLPAMRLLSLPKSKMKHANTN